MVGDPTHAVYPTVHRGPDQPFLHVPNVRFRSPAFGSLRRSRALLDGLRVLLDHDEFQLFERHLFYKPAGEHRVRSWHQDTAYLPFARPYDAVGAWVSLDGATSDGGAMSMVAGSHRMGQLPQELDSDLTTEAVRRAGSDSVVEIRPVPKGFVHFHHPDVWHGSGPNRSSRGRAALSLFFVPRGTRFDGSGPYARFFEGTHGEPLDEARYPVFK